MMTREKHKELVKAVFVATREADKLVEKLEGLGFMAIEGELANVLYSPCRVLETIVSKEILEGDEFFEDFFGADDFEKFYAKWFEEVRDERTDGED